MDFTLLWRYAAQKMSSEQIASELCVNSSDYPTIVEYIKSRIPEATKIVIDSGLSEDQLVRLPKLLVGHLKTPQRC